MRLSGIGRFTAEVLLPLLVDPLVCGVNVLLVIVDPEVLPFPADVSTALMGAAPLFILGRTLVGDFPFLRLVCLLSSSLDLFRMADDDSLFWVVLLDEDFCGLDLS